MEKLLEVLTDLETQKEKRAIGETLPSFGVGTIIEWLKDIRGEWETDADKGIDLSTLIPEQLIAHITALRVEIARKDKKVGELAASTEYQHRTIGEQSDTLNNREKVVDAANARVKELEHERDECLQRIDDLTETHERVKAEAVEMMNTAGNHLELAHGIDKYALAVGRISTEDAHPMVVVSLIQMAQHMRTLASYRDVIAWLNGPQ